MKKLGLFMVMGALAWSIQACNNSNQGDDQMNNSDSLYNNDNMNNNNMAVPPADTSGMETMTDSIDNTNLSDTVGRDM